MKRENMSETGLERLRARITSFNLVRDYFKENESIFLVAVRSLIGAKLFKKNGEHTAEFKQFLAQLPRTFRGYPAQLYCNSDEDSTSVRIVCSISVATSGASMSYSHSISIGEMRDRELVAIPSSEQNQLPPLMTEEEFFQLSKELDELEARVNRIKSRISFFNRF